MKALLEPSEKVLADSCYPDDLTVTSNSKGVDKNFHTCVRDH